MKEKTIQQEIFREIRKRDGINYAMIAEGCGISEDAVSLRMRGAVGFANLVQMLKVCGYDINITKAPEHREAGVFIGLAGCDGCGYKNALHEIKAIVDDAVAHEEKPIQINTTEN